MSRSPAPNARGPRTDVGRDALPEGAALERVRTRTLGTLSVAQVLGALGAGAAPSVGILLASAVVESETWAGLARSGTTIGAALAAVPLGMLAARWGRRGALATAYVTGGVGAGILVGSAMLGSVLLLVAGMLAVGVSVAANFQLRFAAADLAAPDRRGRSIALVVGVGTIGSVLGPNLGVPGEALEARLGLPEYTGAFLIAGALTLLAGLAVLVLLRPDPLRLAVRLRAARTSAVQDPGTGADPVSDTAGGPAVAAGDPAASGPAAGTAAAPTADAPAGRGRTSVRAALRLVGTIPAARFALTAQVLAHLVMVSIMTMTPVHLDHHGQGIAVVGIVISFHVLGMFAFAPVVGSLSDRLGPVPVILAGQVVLGAGAVTCAVAGPSRLGVGVGLFLVGLGWSFVTVPCASMLTSAVTAGQRPLVQGSGDMAMNAVAAVGAIASGPVVTYGGFWVLCLATLPFLVLTVLAALRLRRSGRASAPDARLREPGR